MSRYGLESLKIETHTSRIEFFEGKLDSWIGTDSDDNTSARIMIEGDKAAIDINSYKDWTEEGFDEEYNDEDDADYAMMPLDFHDARFIIKVLSTWLESNDQPIFLNDSKTHHVRIRMSDDRIITQGVTNRICVTDKLDDCDESPGSMECWDCPYNKTLLEGTDTWDGWI